ncbi:MAG: serine/threonine transporter SstT [Anaerovoracaceae bacterium]|nr:serine/threonine transporter SstT [Anaerovoracaceae bacterium]
MNILKKWTEISLVKRIIAGLIIGIILGVTVPKAAVIGIFGDLFVGALKAIAPLLVLFLVMHALSNKQDSAESNMKSVIVLYLISTFSAAVTAVIASFVFPSTLVLPSGAEGAAPEGIAEVLKSLLMNVVANPVDALINANYIGVLAWAVILGLALRKAGENTINVIGDVADAFSTAIRWVINFAPFGIMGLVFVTVSETGVKSLLSYGHIILVLVGCMLCVAFIINPLIVFINIRQNPYPLVLKCIKDSGIMAFFTRSSAANIPVNMRLCENLGLDEKQYSVSIPLGATINMAGAAITITVLTLAAANTLDIEVDFATAVLLSIIASVSACGASGVAGGSLLLIPLACSLLGISNDIAMQVVGVGFIIGVIQDSCETALNSSSDALFTATAEFRKRKKAGIKIEW